MKRGKTISPAEVDFWMDLDKYANFLKESPNETLTFSIDMVRLSSIRRAISNFVRILTRQNVPVYFNDADANVNFGGKVIYISAQINTKLDFDIAVGQALHEGAHSLKTNFNTIKTSWANVPSHILKLSDSKNIRRASFEKFLHNTWNVIEDRFIDNYVFNAAPGYRGYYVALYDKFWNCPEIDELLISDMHRYPSLDSYSFRITNFTNLNTDLMALPRLEDIAKVIDITNIDRLHKTKDRIEKAFEVVEIVLDCIDKPHLIKGMPSQGQGKPSKDKNKNLANPRDYFDFGEESQKANNDEVADEKSDDPSGKGNGSSDAAGKDSKDGEEESDMGNKMINEISDVLGNRDPEPEKLKENHDAVSKISPDGEVAKDLQKQIKNIVESQRKFMAGELPKENITDQQKSLLDLVEKHGIVLVQVQMPYLESGDDKNLKVDCVVVNKMTKELIVAGKDVFPLAGVMKLGSTNPEPPKDVADAVKKGISIGSKLGRKLQIRAESNPIKTVRKKWGKINKRQIHEAAFDADDLFFKTFIEEHKDATLHISVDASSSMYGQKWIKTMTSVVAICKAASMVDNVHITVSFRSTQETAGTCLPYIVLAYDSKKDKFSKVRNLFPYLIPCGWTPEGLAFSAIMNLFDGITPDEEERYFLNLSDGEPFFSLKIPETGQYLSYAGDVGASHTKSQVDKIRRHGVEILSYFIDDDLYVPMKKSIKMTAREIENDPKRKIFRKMYGKNAQFINVESIGDLARTINGLFLSGRK
jgi:hypothetical protein